MPIIADVEAASGPTLDDLVTEVISAAQGHAVAPDKMVTLKAELGSTALTMMIEGTASPGVFEIEDELVLVTAVDNQTGTCTIHPRGRGWQGTTAADHATGEVVVESPTLPRHRAAGMINDQIAGLYPVLFGVGTTTVTLETSFVEVPSDAEFVLDVRAYEDEEWVRVRSWEAEMSSSAAATTGRAVRIPRTRLGLDVQIVYATRPEPFATVDQRWSDTGLPIGVKDVVVLGVLAKFAQHLDLGRLTDRFSTPKGDSQQPQLGTGFAIARQLKAEHQAALDREAHALRRLYPARAHFVR